MVDGDIVKQLVETAQVARQGAYAPYSHYQVGAALLSASGKIYVGANIETVVGNYTHAERFALNQAVFAGERFFHAVAIATGDSKNPFPCGYCLQDLAEFDYGEGNLEIFAANSEEGLRRASLRILLPERFGPAGLGVNPRQH